MGNQICQCIGQQKNTSFYSHKLASTEPSQFSYQNLVSRVTNTSDVQKKSKLTTNDFEPKKFVGTGCYGNVALVSKRDHQNDHTFAMKIIDKNMLKQKMLIHTCAIQKDIVPKSNPFLVSVSNIFQNERKTFILMEHVEPGDLLFYIQKSKGLKEQAIRTIAAEVLQGLKTLHKQGIIFRCLKPQNILVSTDGHVKLSDYWLSKTKEDISPSQNFSGVMQYAAPQLLTHVEYDQKVDMWALGVLLYEMKYAKTPFVHESTEQSTIRDSILQGLYEVDQKCSQQLKNLLKRLLSLDPTSRPTIEELEKDPFFTGVNWTSVYERYNPSHLEQEVKKYNCKFQRAAYIRPKRVFVAPETSIQPTIHQFDYSA